MQASTISFMGGSPGYTAARRKYRLLVESQRVPRVQGTRMAAPAEAEAAAACRAPPVHDKRALAALVCAALALHMAALWIWTETRASDVHAPTPLPPINIEITRPPPPPPPPVQEIQRPKPLPQTPRPLRVPPRHVVAAPKPTTTPMPPAPPQPAAPVIAQTPTPAAAPPAPPAAPPAPAALAPVERITEAHGSAGYLHNPAPQYPDAAQERNWQGRVLLKVHVLADGHPDSVIVAQSSGHQILDDAALKAVNHWLFAPARRGDTPIDGWANVPIDFKL
ncbi:energy transducer TonB [Caballeronia sp. DA-9]|uniref:energy transducer TonB n=1 Tax=Caballeronia sp. DA-9 TaxID=3436237 RepID=UPI003F66F9CE